MMGSPARLNTAIQRRPDTPPQIRERVFTLMIGDDKFGIPVASVQTVFQIGIITPVPLAATAIIGLVNLRGRIVTAVSLRTRMGLPPAPAPDGTVAIGIEHCGEALALVVDEAGDVVDLADATRIEMPRQMAAAQARLTQAIFRIDGRLLCILDLAAVFDLRKTVDGVA